MIRIAGLPLPLRASISAVDIDKLNNVRLHVINNLPSTARQQNSKTWTVFIYPHSPGRVES